MGIIQNLKDKRSKRLKALLMFIIIMFVGIMTTVFLNYRYSVEERVEPERPVETGAAFTISQFEHTAMRDGKKEWSLKADTARLFSDAQKAKLSGMEAIFLLEDGEEVTVIADHGEMDMDSKNINARENVMVYHPEYTLKTESLNYKYNSRIMIIDSPLEITGDSILFTADSARYELDTKTITFEGNIESWLNDTPYH